MNRLAIPRLCFLLLVLILIVTSPAYARKMTGESFYGEAGRLVEILEKENYDKLVDVFRTIRKEQPKTLSGKDTLHHLYYWFVRSDGVTEDVLNEWCLHSPKAAPPYIMRGYYLIRTAWEARGKNVSYTVTEKGRELFRKRLEKARRDFTHAAALDPEDPIPFSMLIVVCRGLGLSRDQMEEYFLNALSADPTNYHAYYQKLKYLFPQWHGSDEEMLAFARSAALQAPPNTAIPLILAEAHWVLAKKSDDWYRYLSAPKVWDQINGVYSDFFKAFPESVSERAFFARYARIARKDELALKAFENAIKLSTPNEILYYERADYYRRKKDYPRAITDYTKSIELNPKYKEGSGFTKRGKCYYYLKRFDEAMLDFQNAIALDTKDEVNYYFIALIYKKQKSYEKAIRYFSIAVGLDPRYANAYSNRGVCYDLIDNTELALADLKHAILLDSDDPFSYNYVGRMLMKRKMYEDAITFFSKVLDLDVNHKWAHTNRGVCYYKIREYDKALLDFKNAVMINPDDPYNYNYIGFIYKKQKRCEEAVPWFSKTIEIDAAYERAHSQRGVCYYLLNKDDEALADLQRAIELNPKDPYNYSFMGHTYLRQNNHKDAVKYYSTTLDLDSSYKDALHGRGKAYLMAGQYQKALEDFTKVLEIDPRDENAIRERGVALRALGKD